MAENEKLNNVAVDNDVGTMEDVDAIMKKYDRESNTRIWEGTPRKILRVLTALFGIFLIVMNMWIKMDERARRPLFLGLVIILVFIYYPIKKGSQKVNYMPWYDIVMAAVGAFCFFFYPLNLEKIVSAGTRIQKAFVVQIGSISIPLLIVFAIIGTLILVECCRRVVGMPIICVAAVFVLYAFFGAGKKVLAHFVVRAAGLFRHLAVAHGCHDKAVLHRQLIDLDGRKQRRVGIQRLRHAGGAPLSILAVRAHPVTEAVHQLLYQNILFQEIVLTFLFDLHALYSDSSIAYSSCRINKKDDEKDNHSLQPATFYGRMMLVI